MRMPIIKVMTILSLGAAIAFISGAAGPARNFAAIPETGLQTEAASPFDAESLPQTSIQGDSSTATGTESSLPTDKKEQNPWCDREDTLLLQELEKTVQQTESALAEREQSHSPVIREIERMAAEEEHNLSLLTWIQQGRDAYASHNIPMALENLRQVEQRHPVSEKLMSLLSLAYAEMGYYNKALECAQNAAAQEPEEYLAQLALGISNAHLGNYDKAIAAFQAAAALEPQSKEPHFFLAECFRATNQEPEAEKQQKMDTLPKDVPDAKPAPEETMPKSTQTEPIRLQMQEL